MNKKFQRTRSSVSTENIGKKFSFFEDDVDEIATSTIIPFVNQRFSVVPKQNSAESKRVIKVQPSLSDKSNRLALLIIFMRVKKMAKHIIGKQFLKQLKLQASLEKLHRCLKYKDRQALSAAFRSIQRRCLNPRFQDKILITHLNFLSLRLKHNQTSYAFRKIAMYKKLAAYQQENGGKTERKAEKSIPNDRPISDILKTVKRSHYQSRGDNRPIQLISGLNAPYQLKPDKYQKKTNQIHLWRVPSHHFYTQNSK